MTEQTVGRQDSSATDLPLSPAWKLNRNAQQDAPKSALIGPFSELAERTASGKLPGAADALAGGLLAPGGSFSRPDKWAAGTDTPPVLRPVVLGGASSGKWREEEREKVQPTGNGGLPAGPDRWTAGAEHPGARRADPPRAEPWGAGRGRGRGDEGRWGGPAAKDTWGNLPGMPNAELADKRTSTLDRWDSGAPGAGVGGSFTNGTWRAGAAAPGAPPAAGARGFTGRGRNIAPATAAAAGGPTAPGVPGRWVSPAAEAKKYTVEQLKSVAESMLSAGSKMPMPPGTSLPDYTDVRAYEADSTRRALNEDFAPPSDAALAEAASRTLSYSATQGHANGSWGSAAGAGTAGTTDTTHQPAAQQEQLPADEGSLVPHAAHPPPGMLTHAGAPSPSKAVISQQAYITDKWVYRDPQGTVQGPFPRVDIVDWSLAGYFPDDLPIRPYLEDPNTWWPLAAMRRAWVEWAAVAAAAASPLPTTPQVVTPQQQPNHARGAGHGAGFAAMVQDEASQQPQPTHTPYLHPHAQQHAQQHDNTPGSSAFLGGGAAPGGLGGVSGFAGWGMSGSPWGVPDSNLGGCLLGTPGTAAADMARLHSQPQPGYGLSTPTTQASLPTPSPNSLLRTGAAAPLLWGRQPDMSSLHRAPQLDSAIRTVSLPGAGGMGPSPLGPGWGSNTLQPWNGQPGPQPSSLSTWLGPDARPQPQQAAFNVTPAASTAPSQPSHHTTAQDIGSGFATAPAPAQPLIPSPAPVQQSEGAPATAAAPQPAPQAPAAPQPPAPQPPAQQPQKAKAAAALSSQALEHQAAAAAAAPAASQAALPQQPSADQEVSQDMAAALNRVAPWAGKGPARVKTLKEIQEEEAAAAAARAAEMAAAAAARAAAEGAAVTAATAAAQPGPAWARPAAPAAAAWGAAAAVAEVDEPAAAATTPPVLAAVMAGARKAAAAKEAPVGTGPGPRGTTLADLFDKKLPGGGSAAPPPAWGGATVRAPVVPSLRDVMTFEESAMDMEGGALDEDLTEVLQIQHPSLPAPAKAAPPPPPPPAKGAKAAAAINSAALGEQDQLFWDYSAVPGTSVNAAPPPPPPAARNAGPAAPGATLAARIAGATPAAAAPAAKPAAAAGPWAAATKPAAAPAAAWGAAAAAGTPAPAAAARAAAAPAAAGTIKVIKPAQAVAPAAPATKPVPQAPTGDAAAAAIADKMSPEFWAWARTSWIGFGQGGDIELLRWLVSLSCRHEISDYILAVVGPDQPGVGGFVAEFLRRKEAEEARLANPGKKNKKGAAAAAQQDKPGGEWQAAVKQPQAKKGAAKGAAAQAAGKGGRANGFALLRQ